MNIIVYTCIVNNYDFLNSIPKNYRSNDVRFICYSDNQKLSASGWEVTSLASPETMTDPALINRYHKFFPDKILPKCEWSIYIDGNILLNTNPTTLLSLVEDNAEMACFEHPQRKSLNEEIAAIIRHNKIPETQRKEAEAQVQRYHSCGLAKETRLMTNFILIRRSGSSNLVEAMEQWWQEFINNTRRDQLSLPYVLWKHNITIMLLPMSLNTNNKIFTRIRHRKKGWKGVRQMLKLKLSSSAGIRIKKETS